MTRLKGLAGTHAVADVTSDRCKSPFWQARCHYTRTAGSLRQAQGRLSRLKPFGMTSFGGWRPHWNFAMIKRDVIPNRAESPVRNLLFSADEPECPSPAPPARRKPRRTLLLTLIGKCTAFEPCTKQTLKGRGFKPRRKPPHSKSTRRQPLRQAALSQGMPFRTGLKANGMSFRIGLKAR
jgi:hypothetical protein